jgi:hypothetical protein
MLRNYDIRDQESRDLKLEGEIHFYQERPHEVAFITALIERKEVVYSVVLARAKNR